MAKIWFNRIAAGTRTYEECPARYKAAVLALLKDSVANNGPVDAEQYKEITGEDYVADAE